MYLFKKNTYFWDVLNFEIHYFVIKQNTKITINLKLLKLNEMEVCLK